MRQAHWAHMETIIAFSLPIQRLDERAPMRKRLSGVCGRIHQVFLPSADSGGEIHSSAEKKADIRY